MVPKESSEIGPAVKNALEVVEARLASDRASLAKDRQRDRSLTGLQALNELSKAVETLKTTLDREKR